MKQKYTYELFNIFDAETHEWWKGLTREQLAGFVAGTFSQKYWKKFEPAVHRIQHEIHESNGNVIVQGYLGLTVD